jgi:hypothetical protein
LGDRAILIILEWGLGEPVETYWMISSRVLPHAGPSIVWRHQVSGFLVVVVTGTLNINSLHGGSAGVVVPLIRLAVLLISIQISTRELGPHIRLRVIEKRMSRGTN